MRNVVIVCLIFFCLFANAKSKNMTKAANIENDRDNLKNNKVYSITTVEYNCNKRGEKLKCVNPKKISTEFYDTFGRKTLVVFYDSIGNKHGRTKYYYPNNTETSYCKIEKYNENDSLYFILVSDTVKGEVIYWRETCGEMCFGYYKLYYNHANLITHAVWYSPKKGMWANDNMKAVYVVELEYSYH
ncbi:MAG: hypothetical protein JST82_09125 [Bacteroidetes bacterium]|nr:hypothetical protein [Bacteroidota bacterium]